VLIGNPVSGLIARQGKVSGVKTRSGDIPVDKVIATPALPIAADLLEPHVPPQYLAQLRRIRYLANLCVVLILDRKLSDTYWLNVNDPGFPFVAVIEHTNFEPASTYGGRHVVYLSKYLPVEDDLYGMSQAEVVEYSLEHLTRMYPRLRRDWLLEAHVWRARYAQPVMERHYDRLIPPLETPLAGCYLASMAQIHPEDRGTNYAVRQGRNVARFVAAKGKP
jgi:protoporphyrinogen oxidase